VIGQTVLGGQTIPLPKFSALLPTPETSGDFEEMCLIAGEGAGLIHEIRPAGEIIADMMQEARQIIEQRLH
jgi:NAD(P)H-dependent flavin oxidoreductase YrpB (nitropropane dioxygenase family)